MLRILDDVSSKQQFIQKDHFMDFLIYQNYHLLKNMSIKNDFPKIDIEHDEGSFSHF